MQDREALLARQSELEAQGRADGAKRFRERLQNAEQHGRGSQVGAARKLAQMAIDPLGQALAELAEHSGPGRKHKVIRWIHALGPDTLAYMTVKCVLDAIGDPRNRRVRAVALNIATLVVDELKFRRLREECPKEFDYRMDRLNTSSYAHRSRALKATLRFNEVDTSDLDVADNDRMACGVKLIDCLVETTQLVTIQRRTLPGRRHGTHDVFLAPTDETLEWLRARNGALEFMMPVNLPMVVPPLPWSPDQRGGYRFAMRGVHTLVRGISKRHAQVVKQADMPLVYRALNAIQDTAWKINPAVLSLLSSIADAGGGMAGVPALENETEPTRPSDIATNEDARKAWRKAAHAVKERNHKRKCAALEYQRKLSVALRMKDEPAIYFPCNLDFRGRVYPVTSYLSPQGDDLAKGLLMFAEPKPVDDTAARWLALHGANCLGTTPDGLKLSKATLNERVQAIEALTPRIAQMLHDPLSDRWWCGVDVDDPLQFYAFCVEWNAYQEARRAGTVFLSSLPCAMDGTCNGLQHFAAMFRDPVGAAAVNVSPSDLPRDIYQRVADAVLKRMEEDAAENQYARLWLASGLITRKITKRPVMTFPYGSRRYGFREQLIQYVRELPQETRSQFVSIEEDGKPMNHTAHACAYLADLIWEALQVVVVAAAQGMAWMQAAARIVARSGKPVTWIVPATGFPVSQEYMVANPIKVKTVLAGQLFWPRILRDTGAPDSYKQANAVAPNFVHSLDAAALMMTVNRCVDHGITSFGMVHDSYATHATDCETLAKETREAFIALYTDNNVVEHFAAHLWQQAPAKSDQLPVPPDLGALDLNTVRESPFFFC